MNKSYNNPNKLQKFINFIINNSLTIKKNYNIQIVLYCIDENELNYKKTTIIWQIHLKSSAHHQSLNKPIITAHINKTRSD